MHGSKFSKPLNILKTLIRSPLTLLVFNVFRFKSRNLSSYVLSFNDNNELSSSPLHPFYKIYIFFKGGLHAYMPGQYTLSYLINSTAIYAN